MSRPALALEKIDNLEVAVKINEDASMNVSEKIGYDFGDAQKHGIFRNIPYRYKARGGNFKLRLSGISVTDENGAPYHYEQSRSGNDLIVKIGDANKFVTGKKTYVINYTVKRAINYFETHDELYWNAIGTEWPVAVSAAKAVVKFPASVETSADKPNGIEAAEVQKTCFAGIYGSDKLCDGINIDSDENGNVNSIIFEQSALGPGEGLTIVVGIPPGVIAKPTLSRKIWETVKDNWIIFIPFLVLFSIFYFWYTRGRDPKGRGTIVAQYEAPDNLTPLETGTIIDERFDNKDISAEIINLAVRGYLKIKRLEEKIFIFKSHDYQLEKIKNESDLPNDFQKKIMKSLFGAGEKIKLSSLRNKFYEDLKIISGETYEAAVIKGYFPKNPEKTRNLYRLIGIAFFGAAVAAGFFYGALGVVSLAVSGLAVIIFSFGMPKKTKKGVLAKEHILGLKEYLQVAEKDRIKFHNAPAAVKTLAGKPAKNPDLFEKLLPYAMVLDVEEEWAEQFKEIYNQHPSWYEDRTGASFNSVIFVNNLEFFSSSASGTLSSSPSSAAGGGSGFSGGGSGGGGGGGGGGSW